MTFRFDFQIANVALTPIPYVASRLRGCNAKSRRAKSALYNVLHKQSATCNSAVCLVLLALTEKGTCIELSRKANPTKKSDDDDDICSIISTKPFGQLTSKEVGQRQSIENLYICMFVYIRFGFVCRQDDNCDEKIKKTVSITVRIN